MARNVEVKARVSDWPGLSARARELWGEPQLLRQRDAFFPCPDGRLKLRLQEPGPSYLIFYRRADEAGPKASDWLGADVADGDAARRLLAAAFGEAAFVAKTRLLFMSGRTRVHLDDVDGLGRFLELEVVLRDGEDAASGEAEARTLLSRLGVAPGDLVRGAYADLSRPGAG
ncbi:MAG: class IV adenylate cyclase [Elusimicrobia bacterium]|nr:class IV adenylate cyclase [Elusimicrobiota bacterium]